MSAQNQPVWQWWASLDEETYTVGPEDTREAVIEAGLVDFDGRSFHIVEAIKGDPAQMLPNAETFVSRALEDAADEGEFGKDGDYDLAGKPEVHQAAFADLDAAIATWVVKWGHLLPTPWKFRSTRNPEVIEGATYCLACDEVLKDDDIVMDDVSGDVLHVACCGPERDSYVKDIGTGEPLGPDDPIPTGYRWGDRPMPKGHGQ
ncbi:hypothetical protein [Brevundimonas subvibrioides]|uniref:Uncharacterized protein n=1 Tax=Brevundimonas subvibrioides (strain ATCC 15264 / DSM 4735 / LMG 14903 / NBRC 16000 / CB 81) TaxID=633149 RepID=D9QIB3_BRESC|nr:hypothetical protein [Brevundimonas subvibrioides]ADK99415.1 hypothetical protein Bresu_0101 [Brevundimonas subvibrioides ATCC 15264]